MKKCKACLVCKGTPQIWQTDYNGAVSYDVQCPICTVGTSYGYSTRDEAVEAWNEGREVGKKVIDRKYARVIK